MSRLRRSTVTCTRERMGPGGSCGLQHRWRQPCGWRGGFDSLSLPPDVCSSWRLFVCTLARAAPGYCRIASDGCGSRQEGSIATQALSYSGRQVWPRISEIRPSEPPKTRYPLHGRMEEGAKQIWSFPATSYWGERVLFPSACCPKSEYGT